MFFYLLFSVLVVLFAGEAEVAGQRQGLWAITNSSGVDPDKVILYLNTRSSPTTPTVINKNNPDAIEVNRKTIIIVHGFKDRATANWVVTMKDEYLKKGIYNIIRVDWSEYAKSTYYYAAHSTRDVGNVLGRFVAKLNNESGLHLYDVHCVGHSMGAHICGFMGKEVYGITNKTIARISGLDPARSMFEINHDSSWDRLDSSDAHHVCVTHTDAGRLGYRRPIGTVDYYPNGGTRYQPGCYPWFFFFEDCSHGRSIWLFIHSINSNNLRATKCNSTAEFDNGSCNGNAKVRYIENCPLGANGTYYFYTNPQMPFYNPVDV